MDVEPTTTREATKQAAIEQYVRRLKAAKSVKQIDNTTLPVNSAMFFYCQDCGIFIGRLLVFAISNM
jgi:hypothetical protein